MPARLAKFLRHPGRGASALALLAVAPKYAVCLAACAGLGSLLGMGGPELCGASPDSPPSGGALLAGCAVAVGLGASVWIVACPRR